MFQNSMCYVTGHWCSETDSFEQNQYLIAAPDFVIEILSESTETLDRITKKELYERYGVKEYWIVDPTARTVEQYVLENKSYRSVGTFKEHDEVEVKTIGGLLVKLSEVFY